MRLMAKIWRRKKNGREVGCFHVLVDKKPVNLRTKDAREANKLARLALAGKWPDSSADDAADVAKLAEHVPEESPPVESPPAANVVASPEAPAVVDPPSPLPDGEPDSDPVASAAAAASDVGGSPAFAVPFGEPVDLATEMGKELAREFFPEGFTSEGQDGGKAIAAVLMGIEYEIGEAIANKRKKTIPEPTEKDFLFRVLACACRVVGRNVTGEIKIHPAYVIAGALCLYPFAMGFAAKRIPGKPEEPAGAN